MYLRFAAFVYCHSHFYFEKLSSSSSILPVFRYILVVCHASTQYIYHLFNIKTNFRDRDFWLLPFFNDFFFILNLCCRYCRWRRFGRKKLLAAVSTKIARQVYMDMRLSSYFNAFIFLSSFLHRQRFFCHCFLFCFFALLRVLVLTTYQKDERPTKQKKCILKHKIRQKTKTRFHRIS